MKTETFLKNLKIIAEDIANNVDRQLLYFKICEPANETSIQLIRENFFSGKDNSILEFYRHCNGVQLVWSFRNDKNAHVNVHPLLFLKRDINFPGVINLLPIEIAFNSQQWKDTVWFEDDSRKVFYFIDNELPNNVVKKKLIPIDFFSVDMSMAIYPGENKNYILLLQDYHIDYQDSLLTFWEDYLEFIIKINGEVKRRYKSFNKLNGFRTQPLDCKQLLDNL